MLNFLLMTTKNKVSLIVWASLLVLFILYYVSKGLNYQRAQRIRTFYKYVFDKYGKDYIGDYESAKEIESSKHRAFIRYEYVVMKYEDEQGMEKTCKTMNELMFVETPELKWIKKQRKGVQMRVFKDFAYFEIPELDVSSVNLAKGYGFKEFIVDMFKGCFYIMPIRKEFKGYYSEFKKSAEYYQLKHPKKKDKRKEYI